MKIVVLTLVACMVTSLSQAQILGGFFSQKKENRKLLAQQIAALQVYKTYVKKGFDIISKGVSIINKIKSGDFDMHRDFFGALKLVKPRIRKYAKVAELMAMNVKSVKQLKGASALVGSELFSMNDNQYFRQVIDHTLQALADTIDELISIVTDNQLELKDDERIARIDALYIRAEEQYGFSCHFSEDMQLYKLMKEKKQTDILVSGFYNGLNQPLP